MTMSMMVLGVLFSAMALVSLLVGVLCIARIDKDFRELEKIYK